MHSCPCSLGRKVLDLSRAHLSYGSGPGSTKVILLLWGAKQNDSAPGPEEMTQLAKCFPCTHEPGPELSHQNHVKKLDTWHALVTSEL